MKYHVAADQTLLEALTLACPDSSKTTLRSWIKDGRVLVDGHSVRLSNHPLVAGQQLLLADRAQFIRCPNVKEGITVYYEDAHLVVVEKPEGLLTVSTDFEKNATLHAYLKTHYRSRPVYPVHRLDQDTSGVMMFALSEEARELLKVVFEKHAIERMYTAIVEGHPEESSGTWTSYLLEDPQYKVHSVPEGEKGSIAITHYETLTQAKRYTVLQLRLETGRKNQIRVHCQDAGCPIVGDSKYGAVSNPIRRMALHASLLAFVHPVTRKPLRFESPLPEAFKKLVR